MRRWLLVPAVVLLLAAWQPAWADHLPSELRFLHGLERVSGSNLCIDPETLAFAVCHIYRDPASPARYRLIYRKLQLVSAWRLEQTGPVLIWPLRPDCSVELCT